MTVSTTESLPREADLQTGTSARARSAALLVATGCLALTLLLSLAPSLAPVIENRPLHVAEETLAATVLLFVAAVMGGRYRQTHSASDLLAFAALVVLAFDNLLFSILSATLTSVAGGFSTWGSAGAGILGASLLACAGYSRARLKRPGRSATIVLLACCGVLAVVIVLAAIFSDVLPEFLSEQPRDIESLRLLSEHPALIVSEVITAGAYAMAAIFFAQRADHTGDEFSMWLALGAVLSAASFLDYALLPSAYTELVYVGDLLLLASRGAFLYGTLREIGRMQASMTEAAVLDERKRMARDLHDGVAQELAFISAQMPSLGRQGNAGPSVDLVRQAAQRALAESRSAISTLSRPPDERLEVVLAKTAEDLAVRGGARIELDLEEGVRVPSPWPEALSRIVREAVTNAVRHGGASVVTLRLRDDDPVWISVSDDGTGFDLDRLDGASGFGLTSMRERTESLGGRFTLTSSPGNGTSIEVVLP